jgi:hypothetical protein
VPSSLLGKNEDNDPQLQCRHIITASRHFKAVQLDRRELT